MSENNKSPTEQSTRPLGNTEPPPTPLSTHINPHIKEKLKDFPDQQRRMRTHLERSAAKVVTPAAERAAPCLNSVQSCSTMRSKVSAF